MIKNKKVLAIIPARGGSKGVPRKNIKLLNGKPLIAYTIEEALKSKYIDRVIVSTEDEEIASISKKYGAEVPFIRPKELAKDDTPGIEPVLHCIQCLEKKGGHEVDYVCLLQCTSPFRKREHIDEAIENLVNSSNKSLVSICEIDENPYWMKKIVKGKMKDFLENIDFIPRRQELPNIYRLNGAIYISDKKELLKNENWYSDTTIPYIMNKISSLDIDGILDFKFAEFLMKENKNV